MTQDILNVTKALARKIWSALTLAPAPPTPRPQLAGRRGYGEGSIKPPE